MSETPAPDRASPIPNTGAEFADEDVVRAYVHRTDYPPALHDRLLDLAPGRERLLDLGCGPGKLARALAPHFTEALAIDPSRAMLALGRQLDAGAHPNIRWIEAAAEDVRLDAPVDLVVAGASLHWMEPGRVFPELARVLTADGIMAVIDGDGPAQAPWIDAWRAVIVDWVGRLGGVWNDAAHRNRMTRHEPWFDVTGREVFSAPVVQPIEDLVDAEHSRATWTRARMGERASAFDADLRAVVAPFAVEGTVSFDVRSTMVWGRPRSWPARTSDRRG